MSLASGISAVLLAGDRGPDDPVARATGSPCKALAPVAGRSMLMRVLDTFDDRSDLDRIVVVGPARGIAEASVELQKRLAADDRLLWIAPGPTPATSASAALDMISAEEPCLITTADHALLTPDLLSSFLDLALARREDVVVGLARLETVTAAFPESRRTAFKLRDGAYCSCNLFLMRNARGRRAAAYWKKVESLRKKPWRIATVFGPAALFGLLTRSLTLEGALRIIGQKIGVSAGAVIVKDAELAVDVDSEADLLLVEKILAKRASSAE